MSIVQIERESNSSAPIFHFPAAASSIAFDGLQMGFARIVVATGRIYFDCKSIVIIKCRLSQWLSQRECRRDVPKLCSWAPSLSELWSALRCVYTEL